jgi:hypothetical protein
VALAFFGLQVLVNALSLYALTKRCAREDERFMSWARDHPRCATVLQGLRRVCLMLYRSKYFHFVELQYSIGCSEAACWVGMHVMLAVSTACHIPHDSVMLSQHLLFNVHV